MSYINKLSIIILIFYLVGCASNTISESDTYSISTKDNSLGKLEHKHKYRLDYFVSGEPYSFSTYEINGRSRYIQVLAKRGEVLAISELTEVSKVYRPIIRRCTLFPFHPDLDVQSCFKEFNKSILEKNDPSWLNKIKPVNEAENERKNKEAFGTTVMAVTIAPIIAPAALIMMPVSLADAISSGGIQKEFQLTLGKNNDLSRMLQKLENEHKSELNNNGTAYIASGIVIEAPEIAFGYMGNDVVWIQKSPSWSCGGGFMFWGLKCTVGYHEDHHR